MKKKIGLAVAVALLVAIIGCQYYGVENYDSVFSKATYDVWVPVTVGKDHLTKMKARVSNASLLYRLVGGPKIDFLYNYYHGNVIAQDMYSLNKAKGKFLIDTDRYFGLVIKLNEMR